jgi:phenylacetate-CoA ligase
MEHRSSSLLLRAARSLRLLGGRLALWVEAKATQRALHRLAAYHAQGRALDFGAVRQANLLAMLRYAYRHVPYYRGLFSMYEVDVNTGKNFSRIPPLDKKTIRAAGQSLVSDRIGSIPHYVMNTGGSTGEPLEFLVSGAKVDPLHQDFFHRLIGHEPGDPVIACDGTAVPQALRDRGIYWVTKSQRQYGDEALSAHHLNEDTVAAYVERIVKLRPAVIRGYPSVIGRIASRVVEKGICLPFRVKAVVLTSENAFEHQVDPIRRAFGTKVYFQYGHSEACVFAYTLEEGGPYYCSPVYGFTEVIGANGEHVSVGEAGEIVVTGFHNRAMPFVRYRTGDIAVFGGEQSGIVRLSSLLGRTQDVVYGKGGRQVYLTALIFGCHYNAFANIRKWQIVQDRAGHLTVRIVRDLCYCEDDEREIRDNFERVGHVTADFEYVDSVPVTPRGKSQLLIQSVGPVSGTAR